MNIKHKDFLISNIIVVVFTILIVLIANNILTVKFGFDKDSFLPITVFLILLGASIYYFLSKQLFDPLFKSDKNIQNLIKETLHEINTPVATIQMNSKMLANKITDEKGKARLKRIDDSCENLLNLYNHMEYSIKEHIDSVTLEKFDLNDIILKSKDKFKDIKKQKNININYEPKSLVLYGDKNGLERVIDNLISNGIKYNNIDGAINISIEGSVLKISDTGIGIDTKNLFSIFDKYYQEDSSQSGMGLGLSIVKGYCDKHTIDIKIDSHVGEGTTFFLDLKGIIWQSKK